MPAIFCKNAGSRSRSVFSVVSHSVCRIRRDIQAIFSKGRVFHTPRNSLLFCLSYHQGSVSSLRRRPTFLTNARKVGKSAFFLRKTGKRFAEARGYITAASVRDTHKFQPCGTGGLHGTNGGVVPDIDDMYKRTGYTRCYSIWLCGSFRRARRRFGGRDPYPRETAAVVSARSRSRFGCSGTLRDVFNRIILFQ